MASNNTITLIGNTGKKPELKTTKNDTSMTSFSIAVERHQSAAARENGDEKVSDWIWLQAFGSLAENIVESVGKGTRMIVTGRLETYTKVYFDEDGEEVEVSRNKVIVEEVGPGLRWATADVERNEKSSKPRRDDSADEEDEKPARKSRAKSKASDGDDFDNEPKPKSRSRRKPADDEDENDF